MRQQRSARLIVALVVILAACDPFHPYNDVAIKIYSEGDGTATVEVDAGVGAGRDGGAGDVDGKLLLDAVVEVLDIGQQAGPAPVAPDEYSSAPSVQLVNVDADRMKVRIAPLLTVVESFGYGEETSVFVSICTSALTGSATGVGVELAHMSSCGVWDGQNLSAPAESVVVLSFEERSAPSARSLKLAIGVAVISMFSALVLALGLLSARRRAVKFVAIAAMLFAAGLAVASAFEAYRYTDTWSSTGQTFDQDLSNGYFAPFYIASIAGLAVPVVVLIVGKIVRWKRRSGADEV